VRVTKDSFIFTQYDGDGTELYVAPSIAPREI
jgi:hypothetical protein